MDCFRPGDIEWRVVRSRLTTAPQDWERRLEESTWLSTTRRLFSAESYDSHAQSVCYAPHRSSPKGSALTGAGVLCHKRQPDARRKARPFNSHPVSNYSPSKPAAMDGVSFEDLDEKTPDYRLLIKSDVNSIPMPCFPWRSGISASPLSFEN